MRPLVGLGQHLMLFASGETVYVMSLFIGVQWLFKVPLTVAITLYFDVGITWIISILLLEEFVKFPAFHVRIFSWKWKSNPYEVLIGIICLSAANGERAG